MLCYNFIVINKLVVEVIKAKKGLDLFYYIRGFPITNNFRIDFNPFYANNKSKVLYTFYFKFTFFNVNL